MAATTCSLCPSTNIAARGWCWTHYKRWSRYGSPYGGRGYGPAMPKPGPNGYWRVAGEYVHRIIFESAFGISGHQCFGCQRALVWRKRERTDPWGNTLVVHHLDGDRSNNDPANLQPACSPCNSRTHLATKSYAHRDRCPNDHPLKGRNVYLRNGYMQCRVCHNRKQRGTTKPPT